jgi:hypothetical protein
VSSTRPANPETTQSKDKVMEKQELKPLGNIGALGFVLIGIIFAGLGIEYLYRNTFGLSQLAHIGIAAVLVTGFILILLLYGELIYRVRDKASMLPEFDRKESVLFIIMVLVMSSLFGTGIWHAQERDNHTSAHISVVVVNKSKSLSAYECVGECTSQSEPEPTWSYSYETKLMGTPCVNGQVKVRYQMHKCPETGMETINEADWQKIRVGQVLKVVELK